MTQLFDEEEDIMDIGSKKGYPAGALSNFTPRSFTFDGVECSSLEGVLQSFKQKNRQVQWEMCKLVGFAAKKKGSHLNWQVRQVLWWNGYAFHRRSIYYQDLLSLLYLECARDSESFRKALLASGDATLTHSIGRNKQEETVLTVREFCNRLTWIRTLLQKGKDLNEEIENVKARLAE